MRPLNYFAAALACIGTYAHADTLYNLNATLQSGAILSGTVGISSSQTAVTSMNLTVLDEGLPFEFEGSSNYNPSLGPGIQNTYQNGYISAFTTGNEVILTAPCDNANPTLCEGELGEIDLNISTFTASGVPLLCSLANPCNSSLLPSYVLILGIDPYSGHVNGFNPDEFASGSLSPAAITPEPSSIVLLGTGLLGLAGAVRKRLLN